MKNGKIQIGIIGAGEMGTPMLKQFIQADFVEIVGVADLDDNAPGMVLARENGITTTNEFMEIAKLGESVDIIIDVTGVAKVREELRGYYQNSENHHTIIMHEMIAVLMMSLSQGKLMNLKHGEIEYA